MALVLLALVYSGNPAVERVLPREPQLVLLALLFGCLLLRRTRRICSSKFVVVASMFAAILLVQCLEFSFWPTVTIAGYFVRLFIGYAVIRLTPEFSRVFVRAMVGLAWLSFAFYVPYMLLSAAGLRLDGVITHVAEMLGTATVAQRPLFLYTFLGDFSPRNSGMFWEPGAFQGYLILALVFLAFIKHDTPRKQYIYYLAVLCAAVLSTFSTTGYIALGLIPLLHYEWRTQDPRQMVFRILVGVYLVLPCMVGGGLYAYKTLPFLSDKVHEQYLMVEMRRPKWETQRYGSLVFDWKYISTRPLFGWGINWHTRYALDPESIDVRMGHGNGMSDFTASFGFLGMCIWSLATFLGIQRFVGAYQCCLVMLILFLLLQGERFLGHPMFLGLMFLGPEVWAKRNRSAGPTPRGLSPRYMTSTC